MTDPGKPDVSVIIPTFNRLWSLPKAIDSCRQNDSSTQIVVVDDGSTDGTWDWLCGQPDVTALRTRNWGKCWAANAGVAMATGQYVRFLDSDDWLLPGANDRQLAAAREIDADLVLGGTIFVDDDGTTIAQGMPLPGDFLANWVRQVWSGTESAYCAFLVRRSLAASIPHRPEYLWHDILLMMEIALTDPVVARCDFPTLVVREHSHDKRVSAFSRLERPVEAYGNVQMCRRIFDAVRDQWGPGTEAERALLEALWLEARRSYEWDRKAATELMQWILDQDRAFEPPLPGPLRAMYGILGFRLSERLGAMRRSARRLLAD